MQTKIFAMSIFSGLSIFFTSGLVFGVGLNNGHERALNKAPEPIAVSKKNVATQESIVELQGKTFRKIQYEKDIYYLEMTDSTAANESYRLMCLRGNDEKLPSQVKAAVKMTQRSQFIVEGLRQYCLDTKDSRREVSMDARIFGGLELNIDKNLNKKNKFFNNKKLIITPVDGMVFKADW